MYNNIGNKIKFLAKAALFGFEIAAVIIGIVFMSSDSDLIALGLLMWFVIGPITSWVSSVLLYGFGELIDRACAIERNTRGGKRISEAQEKADSERINKLEKLRSQGLITEEEFQQAISKEQ